MTYLNHFVKEAALFLRRGDLQRFGDAALLVIRLPLASLIMVSISAQYQSATFPP